MRFMHIDIKQRRLFSAFFVEVVYQAASFSPSAWAGILASLNELIQIETDMQ